MATFRDFSLLTPQLNCRLLPNPLMPTSCYLWSLTGYPRATPCRRGIYVLSEFPTELSLYLPLTQNREKLRLPVLPGMTLISYCSNDVTEWGAGYDVLPQSLSSLSTHTVPVPFLLDLSTEGTKSAVMEVCNTLQLDLVPRRIPLRPSMLPIGMPYGTFSEPIPVSSRSPTSLVYMLDADLEMDLDLTVYLHGAGVASFENAPSYPGGVYPPRLIRTHYDLYVKNHPLIGAQKDMLMYRSAALRAYSSPYVQ